MANAHVIARQLDEVGNLNTQVIVQNAGSSAIYIHKDLSPVTVVYSETPSREQGVSISALRRTLPPHVLAKDLVELAPGESRIFRIKIDHLDGHKIDRATARVLYGANQVEFQLEQRSRLKSAGEIDLWTSCE